MTNNEILKEIKALRKKIDEDNCRYRILLLEVENLELLISEFTEYYYSVVGYLAPHVKNDNEFKDRSLTIFQKEELDFDYAMLRNQDREGFVTVEIRNIYRKLVRLCHPDTTNVRGDEKEIFSLVNKAYNDRDLAGLIKLEKILCTSDEEDLSEGKDGLTILRKEYASIVNEIDKLEIKQYNLLNSAANILRQRVITAKIQGYDLIDEIKQEMLKSINQDDYYLHRSILK